MEDTPKRYSKASIAYWALYNWAHDPFASVITSFVFAAYFISKVAVAKDLGTAEWGWTAAVAGIIVAIIAPFLGAFADVSGKTRLPLALFTLLTMVCTALLWFTAPNTHWVWWALIMYGLALVGFELAILYYNAMLKSLAPKRLIGRISGWGWACGYFAGIITLLISLYVFIKPHFITHEQAYNVRIVPVFIAAWLFIFCWPLFFVKTNTQQTNAHNTFRQGVSNLGDMFKNLKHYSVVFRFVLARLFYIDGLNTVFTFAGIFAATVFHFTLIQVLYFAIAANIVAGVGTVILAFIDDWLGPRFVIFWSLIVLLVGVAILYFDKSALIFWITSMVVAFFSGAMQASSRCYLTHISPKHLINQMFGIYSLTGRITSFIGPLLSGIFVYTFNNVRGIMAVVFVLSLIGLLIFITLPSTKTYTLDDTDNM